MGDYIDALGKMETGAITDAYKLLGYDGWMEGIYPIDPDFRVCGRAFTIQYAPVSDPSVKTYNYYELLNEIHPGDVIVLAANGCRFSIIGENMQHASKKLGAAGIILDGMNRDTPVMRKFDQPVFSKGHEVRFMPGNFKPVDYNIPVMCGGVRVCPGDYILGDMDGVIVISQGAIEETLFQAERITEIETQMDEAIESGLSMSGCARIIGQKAIKRTR